MTLLASISIPLRAPAADFSLHSETIWQGYRIRGRDGLFSIPRARITQLLYLQGNDLLGLGSDLHAPANLGLVLNLGLDHDFGVQNSRMDPSDPTSFVPSLSRTDLGMFTGYISGSFGHDPMFTFRLGRLMLIGPAGFSAMDGFDVELKFAKIIRVGFALGVELVHDVRLTLVDFSPEGVAWGDRRGYPDELHPEVIAPRPRPLLRASLGLDIPLAGTFTISYRATWADPKFEHIAMEKLGIGLELSGFGRPLSVSLRAAYDLVWSRVSDLEADIEIRPRPVVGFGMSFVHLLPLFDTSSIFNVFDVDPHDEIGLFIHLGKRSRSKLSISAGTSLRLTQVVIDEQANDQKRFSDISGWLLARISVSPLTLVWTARGSGGQSGILAGTTARALLGLVDGRLTPGLGFGLWYWNDPLRRAHHGITAGGSATLSFTPVEAITVVGAMDLYNNRVSGTGFSTTVRLVVEM